jgi:hypothetical protein
MRRTFAQRPKRSGLAEHPGKLDQDRGRQEHSASVHGCLPSTACALHLRGVVLLDDAHGDVGIKCFHEGLPR